MSFDSPTPNLLVLLEELNLAKKAYQAAQAKYDAAKNSLDLELQYGGFFSPDEISTPRLHLQEPEPWTGISDVFTLKGPNGQVVSGSKTKVWTGISDVYRLKSPKTE